MFTMRLDDGATRAALTRAVDRLEDPTPLMADIRELVLASTKARFAEGKSPAGAVWAPKSATTLEAYRRRNDRADPRPLFGPSRRLSSEIVARSNRTQVEIGSNLVYAAAMQNGMVKGYAGRTSRGGPIPWGNIPARPFLGLSQTDETLIVETVGDYLNPTL